MRIVLHLHIRLVVVLRLSQTPSSPKWTIHALLIAFPSHCHGASAVVAVHLFDLGVGRRQRVQLYSCACCSVSLPSMQVYREIAREWACHLYAFAAPNNHALKALAAVAPIIEVGAGVGYWALLLRQAGVDVVATDELPTTKCTDDNVNKYHGKIPPLTEIEEASGKVAAQHKYVTPDLWIGSSTCKPLAGHTLHVSGSYRCYGYCYSKHRFEVSLDHTQFLLDEAHPLHSSLATCSQRCTLQGASEHS
jgi:hypothetical protein